MSQPSSRNFSGMARSGDFGDLNYYPTPPPREHGPGCVVELALLEKHSANCRHNKMEGPGRSLDDSVGSYHVVGRVTYHMCARPCGGGGGCAGPTCLPAAPCNICENCTKDFDSCTCAEDVAERSASRIGSFGSRGPSMMSGSRMASGSRMPSRSGSGFASRASARSRSRQSTGFS